jgi:hypothetical protein
MAIIKSEQKIKEQKLEHLLNLIKELELAIALSSSLSSSQSKKLQTSILKLVKQI